MSRAVYTFLSVVAAAFSCSTSDAAIPHSATNKICTVPGRAKERAVLRIGSFGKIDARNEVAAKDADPLEHADHLGIRYTSNLIVADLAWECPVTVLNDLMRRHRACIVSAQSGTYVAFQIPNTESYQKYKSIEADFIRNDCVERISPTFDLRASAL